MTCLVAGLLTWVSYSRYTDYQAFHYAIAQESVAGTINQVSSFVQEKRRLVALFAEQHQALLQDFIDSPDEEVSLLPLQDQIARFFPNYFTFTVADTHGQLYLEDFEGLVGEQCRHDIQRFAKSGQQTALIHPHPDAYHFDVLAPLDTPSHQAILFVSFHADILGGILRSAQSPGHQVMLLRGDIANLIEVTADGARINWSRDDYRLSQQEAARILNIEAVPETEWFAADLHMPDLFSHYRTSLVWTSSLMLLVFICISFTLLFFLLRAETLRKRAELHKDEFLSVISHELRTPLTSIMGSLSLIVHGVTGEVSEHTREMAKIALKNSQRLGSLVNDILDLRKIESGKMEYDLQTISLAKLIERSLQNNHDYAAQYNICFAFEADNKDILVNGDENRLAQVMDNLLSNAVKYGRSDDTVVVSMQAVGPNVRVCVIDKGPGIPADFRDQIFEKFSQADGTATRHNNGTGLGLCIAKEMIQAHGGKIDFISEVGIGTTFYFELPMLALAAKVA